MKKKIKKIVHLLLDPVVTRLGYMKSVEIIRNANGFDKSSLLETFFLNLKEMGLNPKHIVDVGANHGTWTRETLKYFPDAYYTLLEPQEWLKPSLQDLLDANDKIRFNAVGAGAQSGSFNFTIVHRDDSCSFRYSEEEAKEKGYKQVEIPIVTLNELIEGSNLPIPDIVKIDAEGLDIDVLKGADSLFGKTEVFMVEAGVFNKVFDNSFLEMITFMDEKGYRLFEITDLNRPFQPQVLWLVELAFVKKGGIIDSYTINF
jgi:FkbM family methyltransferase